MIQEDLSYTPRSVVNRPKRDKRLGATPATSVSAARDRAIAGTPVLKGDNRVLNSPVFRADGRALLPLEALTDRTCRFPLGDPLLPGFGFCGKATTERHDARGRPISRSKYCEDHHRISTVRMETTR